MSTILEMLKARERLLKLYRNKLLDRARYPNEPYIYFTRGLPKSHKMNHYVVITEVLMKIIQQLPVSSRIDYDIEVKTGDVITDLVVYYKNNFRGESATLYVEVELDSSADIEAKIRAYETSIEEGWVIIACKHLTTLKRANSVQSDLNIIATDLDINLGGFNFR